MKSKDGFLAFILHIHPPRIDQNSAGFFPTMCLGGISFFLAVCLCITGFLLMLFFEPGDPQTALNSMITIEDVVFHGRLIRSAHYWAGQLMVITVVMHLIRVLLTGAYAPPREGNWMIGVLLLLITIILDFSGYLLIGDSTARHASSIVWGITAEIPLLGEFLQQTLFGGNPVTIIAGLRLYFWHCIFLPFLLLAIMAWHFFRVGKDGGVKRSL